MTPDLFPLEELPDALREAEHKGKIYGSVNAYCWRNPSNPDEPLRLSIRYELDGDKTFRTVVADGDSWQLSRGVEKTPSFYGLPCFLTWLSEVEAAETNALPPPVLLLEGEKCVDAALGVNYPALTCGSQMQFRVALRSMQNSRKLSKFERWILCRNLQCGLSLERLRKSSLKRSNGYGLTGLQSEK